MKKSTLVFLLGFTTGALATVLTSRCFRTATGHLNLHEGTKRRPLDYSTGGFDLSGALSEDAPETSGGIKMRPFPHKLIRPTGSEQA